MSNSPPPDDNYLETLSRFGITVNRVAKKSNPPKPEEPKQPSAPTEKSDDIDHLLSNSSISLIKKIPKLTPKPPTPPTPAKPTPSTPTSEKADDEDPLSRLGLLGIGVSIKRKSSVDNTRQSAEEVQRKTSVDSLASEESLSSSVSIQRRPIVSHKESIENLPSSISIVPRNQEVVKEKTPEPEKVPEKVEEAKPEVKKTQVHDNEQPSTSRASSRSSKFRRASAANSTLYNWLDYESPHSRCNSASSSISQTPSNPEFGSEPESDASEDTPKRKSRGGRRGRGRGRGRRRGTSSRRKKVRQYEYDADFRTETKVNPVPRRQTRGKKICVNNYSESEESDFERYINEESSESPLGNKISAELKEQQELEKLLLEQEIKEELLDEQEQLLSELEKADFGDELAEEEHEEEEEALNDGDIEDDIEEEELLLEDDEDEESNPDETQEESKSTENKTVTKPVIKILKNEDYSEVLRSKTVESEPSPAVKPVEQKSSSEVSVGEKRALDVFQDDNAQSDFEDCDISLHLTDNRSVSPGEASTDYTSDYSLSSKTGEAPKKRRRSAVPSESNQDKHPSDELFCWHCKRNFSKKNLFWRHISSHIRLPFVYLTRVNNDEIEEHCGAGYEYIPPENRMASLKLTLKTNNNHEFEIINKPDLSEKRYSSENSESGAAEEDSGMELDEALGSDNMELDSMDLEENKNLANTDQASDSGNGSEQTESVAGSDDRDDKADVERELTKQEDEITIEQTYIPGVRIRSLESVQKLETSDSGSAATTPTSSSNSPTLRVRTNLTSPQSNFLGTQPNLYTEQQQQQQVQQYDHHQQQQQYNPQGWQGGQYNQQQQQPMGPPMYSQQSTQQYNNNGNSYYSSYNQTTFVGNGGFSPNPAYWTNNGNQPVQGAPNTNLESTDPLAMSGEDDPLKMATSGEKEQETHGNLLKSFLDGQNSSTNVSSMGTDNGSAAEFMPLDRLVSSTTCSVCSERFTDASALEEHKRLLNHFGPQPPTTSPSNALQPIGSQALQTLATAHTGLQPIQHQIRVQHNVIVNNVIQQGAMAPIPPYGQTPGMVDNSMQQLAQQVNRMPPPNNQYPGYQQNQGYGQQQQQPYRHPALPAPPGPNAQHGQQPPYAQNTAYGQPPQYNQYQTNQSMPHAAPNSAQPVQTASPSQQYQQNQPRPGLMPGPRPGLTAPGMQNVRPRGQAYLPATQAGPPPPHGMRGPVRGQYRPGPMSRTRPQMGPRLQGPGGPPRPGGPGLNQASRMRRPNVPAQQAPDPKRKRMDMLLPDRHEDPDCHVIAVQQRNDDLPVIQNVQGNVSDPTQDALNKAKEMIQLTDSITLSVRGKDGHTMVPQEPVKAPSNAVADILATRGITVTPAAKSNGSSQLKPASNDNASVAINLNNAVTLIPASKSSRPTTVDLTDESPSPNTVSSLARPNKPYKCSICPKQFNSQELYTQHVIKHRTLPYRCESCNAAYPKQLDLINHQKTCRAAVSQRAAAAPASSPAATASDLGLPVVDLRKPQVLQNLTRLGIQHYIPLARGNTSGVFGLPVVSVEGARNPNIINLGALGASNLLPLGPVRQIQLQNNPRQQAPH